MIEQQLFHSSVLTATFVKTLEWDKATPTVGQRFLSTPRDMSSQGLAPCKLNHYQARSSQWECHIIIDQKKKQKRIF